MLQNLQNFATFQKIQLDNLVDFEKCCKTRIFLQKSVPIQPKTSDILPKICQKLATTLRVPRRRSRARHRRSSRPTAGAGARLRRACGADSALRMRTRFFLKNISLRLRV